MKKTQSATDLEKLIYSMLTENTGIALCDSGGENGRHWQRNQRKTIEDFRNEAKVEFDFYDGNEMATELPTHLISVFHLMNDILELDDLCNEFNTSFSKMKDWDGDVAYGISEEAEKWLEKHGLSVSRTWNTYNGDEFVSQTLQGADLHEEGHESEFEFPKYHLIQIHNGADVRGGYTDAKLFRVRDDVEYFTTNPTVYTSVDIDEETIELNTSYNGYSLSDEEGNVDERIFGKLTNEELAHELTKNAEYSIF